MHFLISNNNFCVEFDHVLDNYFKKIYSISYKLTAQIQHVLHVQNVNLKWAQLVRVVLAKSYKDIFLFTTFFKQLLETIQRLFLSISTEKSFNN